MPLCCLTWKMPCQGCSANTRNSMHAATMQGLACMQEHRGEVWLEGAAAHGARGVDDLVEHLGGVGLHVHGDLHLVQHAAHVVQPHRLDAHVRRVLAQQVVHRLGHLRPHARASHPWARQKVQLACTYQEASREASCFTAVQHACTPQQASSEAPCFTAVQLACTPREASGEAPCFTPVQLACTPPEASCKTCR